MNDANRDLLVLAKTAHLSPEELDHQVTLLNMLLRLTENWDTYCTANEILDINRRRIIQQPHQMQKILREKKEKPFVFTNNKN
jgi:hypothetical protein